MADVQTENGYIAIANNLFDAICNSGFSAMEIKVVLAIVRYTYGYNKKEAEISLGTIANFINHKDRASVSRAVTRLIKANIIHLAGTNGQNRVLRLNKDYDTWDLNCCHNNNCCRNDNSTVAKMTTEVLPKQQQILYTTNNKTINKTNTNEQCCRNDNSTVAKMTTPKPDFSEEFESLWKLYPRKKGKSSVTKKAMKELREAGFDTVKKAIENYKAEIQKFHTQEQYIMHGSTFFNGGWKDYTESEVNSDADPYANVGTNL